MQINKYNDKYKLKKQLFQIVCTNNMFNIFGEINY